MMPRRATMLLLEEADLGVFWGICERLETVNSTCEIYNTHF